MLKQDTDARTKNPNTFLWAPIWAVCLICGAVLFYFVGREIGQQKNSEAAWNDAYRPPDFPLQSMIGSQTPQNSHAAQPLIEAEEKFIEKAGKDTPEGAAALSRLAGFYALQGDYTSAVATYQELFVILTNHLGSTHPSVASVQQDIRILQGLHTSRAPGFKATETNTPPPFQVPAGPPARP